MNLVTWVTAEEKASNKKKSTAKAKAEQNPVNEQSGLKWISLNQTLPS